MKRYLIRYCEDKVWKEVKTYLDLKEALDHYNALRRVHPTLTAELIELQPNIINAYYGDFSITRM